MRTEYLVSLGAWGGGLAVVGLALHQLRTRLRSPKQKDD